MFQHIVNRKFKKRKISLHRSDRLSFSSTLISTIFLAAFLILAKSQQAEKQGCEGGSCQSPEVLERQFPLLPGPTIAYGIMVYQRQGKTVDEVFISFQRLFNAIYHPENFYAVHVDSKSEDLLISMINGYLQWFSNAASIYSVSVSWGGITVVERTLALMQTALEKDNRWSYFVNIGQEDYPLVSQFKMSEWLSSKPLGTNYIMCWDIEGHHFFGQWEHHERRVEVVSVDNFQGLVQDTNYKRLRESLLDMTFYKSLQQTMLSREFVFYACFGIEPRRILLYLANSKAPDEIYFPTVLQSDAHFKETATCNDTRHYSHWIRPGGSWHPEYLEIEHIGLLLKSDMFFARKVNEKSEKLLDAIDALMTGATLESLTAHLWNSTPAEALPFIHDPNDAKIIIDGLDQYRQACDRKKIVAFLNWIKAERDRRQALADGKFINPQKDAATVV